MTDTQRLFHPYANLDGILRCSQCGELFLHPLLVRQVAKQFTGLPPWKGETDWKREQKRRRKHAEQHVARGEALLTREGLFVLTPKPAPTARDFGFKNESTAA